MKERYRYIPGTNNQYLISNSGAVFSLPQIVKRKTNGKDTSYVTEGRFLPIINDGRYLKVALSIEGKTKHEYLHRLLYSAFSGAILKGNYIDHIDRDPFNNALKNLRQVNPTESQLNTGPKKSKINSKPAKSYCRYKGVAKSHNKTNPYVARYKGKHLGYFKTAKEAAVAYDKFVTSIFPGAYTNF